MIRLNIVANVISRGWTIISAYLFVPLYLRFLGIEAYGLVGFYSTLVAVLAFADLGFTATLNREMARLAVRKDGTREMGDLLRTYEALYLGISGIVAAALWASSPFIAQHWLQFKTLTLSEVTFALRLMGLAIAFHLPAGLYTGGLMGLQRQVLASGLQIMWSMSRAVGGVLVLWLCSPTIIAFSTWQVVSNLLCCLIIRAYLWRVIRQTGGETEWRFSWPMLHKTWRYAIGMTGMAMIAALLTQADKAAVSKMLTLDLFGYYTIASALAYAPIALAAPVAVAIFPRMAGLAAVENRVELSRVYHRACALVVAGAGSGGLTIAAYAPEFIRAWTGSSATAQRAGLAASLLVIGQLIQVVMILPSYLPLVYGQVRMNLKLGIASFVLVLPLLILLIGKYGITGAATAWLIMNMSVVLPYTYVVHRRFLRGEFAKWALNDVGLPSLGAVVGLALCRWLIPVPSSRLLTLGLIGLVWAISATAAACISPELRAFWKPDWIVNRKRYSCPAS
jgi:O-antigen/teichoic acid export membrane protein